MVFIPSLNYGETDGFQELIESLISSIFKQGSLINRIDNHIGSDYQVKIKKTIDII